MEFNARETSNPILSPKFPEGRMLFLQRFERFMCLDGGNRPLGESEEEEKKREAAAVRKNELERFNRPPPRYILDGFTIRNIRTNIRSIQTKYRSIWLIPSRILVKDRIEF
jgi:hypothetical protein